MLQLRGQSGPGSNGNEGVLRIPQSSSTAGTSPSDCLVSYPGHSLGWGLTPLQRCSQCILQPQLTGQIIKTSEDFLKRYTSHFIKRVVCERGLETEQRLQHIDIAVCCSRSGLLNRRPWGPLAGCYSLNCILSLTHLISN